MPLTRGNQFEPRARSGLREVVQVNIYALMRSQLTLPQEPFAALHLDCAGEGPLEFAQMVKGSRAVTYGARETRMDHYDMKQVELLMKTGYDYAAFGSFEAFRITRNSFSLVVVAGQGDLDMEPKIPTRESQLLRAAGKLLVPGGILVANINTWLPDDALDVLERQFSDVNIWGKTPGVSRSRMVVGVKKPASSKDQSARDRMILADAAPSLPPKTGTPRYTVPVGTGRVESFVGDAISDAQAEQCLRSSAAYEGLAKRCRQARALDSRIGRPPCELHKGHIAMLLAAGHLDGVVGEGPDAHVVLGSVKRIVRTEDISEEEEAEKADDDSTIVEKRILTFRSAIHLVSKEGDLTTFGGGEDTDTPAV